MIWRIFLYFVLSLHDKATFVVTNNFFCCFILTELKFCKEIVARCQVLLYVWWDVELQRWDYILCLISNKVHAYCILGQFSGCWVLNSFKINRKLTRGEFNSNSKFPFLNILYQVFGILAVLAFSHEKFFTFDTRKGKT